MGFNKECPICQSGNQHLFVKRAGVPVHQNLLIDSQKRAMQITRGNLDLTLCRSCGFIYNSSFDINKLEYGSDYENTQSFSPFFNQYMNNLIHEMVIKQGIQNKTVVEVGCGKGLFLKRLVEYGNNVGIGFDPSYIGEHIQMDGKLRFEKKFYSEECTDVRADVVVCRHVIEHVSDPVALLKSIRKSLSVSPNARVFFETPCVEWILRNKVSYDFFYEHCSYFSKTSLTTAFQQAGFHVVNVKHIFNGQYLWLEATIGNALSNVETKDHSDLERLTDEFASYETKWLENFGRQLDRLSLNSRIAVWGAGAKGVTLLNLLAPQRERVDCVIDINPNKVGNYIPGTGHEIISIDDIKRREVSLAIVMNPNYLPENEKLVWEKDLNIKLVLDASIIDND